MGGLPPLRLDRTHTDIERARKKDGEGERAPERQERLYRQKRPTTEAKKPTIEAKRFRHIQTATTRPPATTTRTRSRTKIRGQKSFLPHSSRRRRRQASVADTCNPGTDTNNFKIEANSRARYYLAGSWNVYILEMQFLFFLLRFFLLRNGSWNVYILENYVVSCQLIRHMPDLHHTLGAQVLLMCC